jgi:hypothetical protein
MPTVTEHRPVDRLPAPRTRRTPSVQEREPDTIREVRRVRGLELELEAFVVGALTVIAVWAMLELEGVGGWPNRMTEHSGFGSWGLWILLAWGSIVAVHAVVAYVLPSSRPDERRASGRSGP